MKSKELELIKIKQIIRFVRDKIFIEINETEIKIFNRENELKKPVVISNSDLYFQKAKEMQEENTEITLENALYFLLSDYCPKEVKYINALKSRI